MAVRGIVPTAMATVLAAAASFLVLMTPTIAVNPELASRSLQKRAILTDVTYTSGTSFITISWGSGIFPEYSNMTLTLRGPGLSSPVIHVVPSPWYEGSKRFSGLMSGEQYTLSVLVDSLNQTTGSQNYTVPTKPEAPQAVVGSTVNTTFISLRWRPGSETAPDRYSVIYRNTRNPAHLTEVKTPEPTIIIRNLLPGRNYSIEVRAEKFGEVSNKAQVYMVTAPLPPTIVNLTAAGTQRLYLQWRPDPTSLQSNYDVFYTPSESGNTRPAPQCSGRTQLSCFIDVSETGKLPGHSYLVTVNARQGTVVSEQAVRYVNTKPEMPTVLKLEPIGPQSLSLAWEPNKLSIQNTFEVSYTVPGTERPKMIVRGCRLSAPYQCMVDMRQAKLLPGQMYRFTIIAISKGVRSAPAIAEAHTNPLKPAIVTLQATGTQTIRVEWKAAEKSLQSLFEVSYESANERSTRTVVRSCSSPEKPICTMDVSDADRLPGSAFIVAVTAVQFQSRSEPVRGQVNTVPLPATKLFIKERTTSSLVIAWPPPTRTIFSGFNISMSPEHGTIGGAAQINSSMWATVINGLQPGTPYRVQMVTLSGEARSQTIDLVFYTKPIAPSPPVMEITTVSSITIKWVPPSSGHYEKFRLRIVDAHSGRKPINTTSPQVVSKEDREVTFSNLFPGKLYVLMVETAVGIDIFSSPASSKMYTKPLPTTGIQLKEQTETHIAVTWEPAENSRFTGFEVRLHEVTGSVRRITAESPREVVFNDLRSGSAYTVEVVVKSGERRSDAVSRIFGTLPYPPQDVKVQTLANNSMTLTWNSRGQRDRFTVTVQTTQQGFFFRTWNVESDVTTLTVTGLSAGVAYTIKLLAVAGPYQSRPVILNSVASRPNSPHSLVITRKGTTTISFRWSAPANSGVDSYVIKIINMALAQVESERDTLTLTEQQFNGLRPGATYRIQVFAKKLNQLGTALEGQVTLDPNPAEDVNLKFVGKTSIQMEWKPPLDSDFDGYQLRYVTPSGGVAVSKTLSMEARSFEMVGLKAGTTYRITLQAVSRNQSSQAIEKLTTTLPASVATLELDGVGMTTVNMSWTEPENTGIDAYKLELTKAGESRGTTLQVKRGDPLMCTFRQLTPGATYNIRLTVIVNGRQSTPVVRDFTTKPMPVISIIAETIGASTIKLTWTVSLSGVQDTFKVTWRRHDLIQSLTEAATVVAVLGRNTFDAQIGGLLPGFRYQFFITSFSNNEASNPKAVNATTFPTAVNNVNAEAISSDSVRVTWNPPVESHYDHVLIEYRGTLRQSSRDWSRVQATESPAVLTGMFPGEMYQVKLTAVSADKLSGIRMTSVLTYPLPPSRVMIEKEETTMTSVKLTWVYDTATNYIIRWRIIYNIQELATEIIRNVDGAYTTEATIAGLQPGQTYSFRIYGVTLNDLTSQNYAMTNGTLKPICDTILKEDSDITNNETVAILYTENSGIHDRLRFTINTTPPYSIEKYATDEDRRVVFTRRGIKAGTSYTVTARALSQDEISSQFSTVKVDTVPNLPDFFGGNKAGGSGVEGGTQKQEGDKEGENKGEGQGDGSTGGDNQGTSGGTSGNQGGSTDNQGIGSGDQGSTDGGQGTNGGTGGSRDGDQESRGGTGGSSGGDQGSRGGTGGSAGGDRESSGGNGGSTGGNRDGSDGQGAVSTGGPGGSQGSDGSNHERNQGTGGDGQGSSRTRGGSQQGGGNRDGGQDGGGNTEKPGITTYSNKGDNDRRGGGDNQGGQDVTRETYISTTQSSVGGGSEGDNQNNRGNQGDGDQRSTDRGTTGDWPYNPTIIIIYLTHISGGADYFIIRCLDCPTNQTIRVGYTLNGTMEARFVDLEPDTTYRFSIVAVKGSKRSPPQTFTRKTQEAPPSAVNNLKYTYDDNYPFSLAITWEKPSVIKGVLRKYIVEYTGTYKGKENDSASLSLDVNQTSIMIRDLKAGFTYKFDVYGFTVVNGEVSSFTYKVPVLVAEPTTTRLYIPSTTTPLPETTNPNDVSTLKPAGDSQTTFQPVLPGDKTLPGVSDDKTTVRPVVSDDKSTLKPGVPDVKTTLRSGVSDDKSTLPPGMPLGKTTLQPGVSIGQPHTPIPSGTQQTGDVISLQPGVITGSTPNLQPSDATQHHIIPSDSSNEPQTTPDLDLGVTLDSINTTGLGGGAVPVKPSPEPDFDWTTTIIVICVILGIIFIGMLCLICYCLCKGDQAAKASKTANMTDLFKPAQKRGKRVETSIPVRIVDYEKYYMDLAAKSYFKFSEQFEDLKYVGRDQSCNAGIMPNNQQKNRFTNVLPYDFSRVMLMPRSDIEGSDYINASFIPGCNSKREYIATQGPLPQTRNDFWRMVWEQNAACIIMLTQCIEEGKDKSDYYWPQSKDEPRMYGSIQVQLARESPPRENKQWAVREFILYKGGLSRRTTMFHFTAWPDFSVPNNPQSLIRFIHRFRQDMTGQDGRPKVVMCSAGVGRTGVLLGLDILLQKLLKNEQIVDIYGLVHFLRQHRPMMVQTEQQYIFLHQCVLHILKQRDPNNATWDSFLDAKISTDDERPLSDSWS